MDEHEFDDLPLRQKRGQRRSEGIDRRAERLRAPAPVKSPPDPMAPTVPTTAAASAASVTAVDPVVAGEGLVVAITRGQCEVEMDGEIVLCHLPKALALVQKSDLAVGDRLRVARRPNGELVVAQVLPRQSRLSRPDPLLAHRERVLAANIDLAVVVTALRKPALATGLLDRFLVALAHGGVPAAIVVNKYDLAEAPSASHTGPAGPADIAGDPELARLAPYRALRIPFLFCSAKTGLGIEELRDLLAAKTVVFVGHSGVGKSSLLSALSPELDVRVGEVSAMNARGRHTTTRARIYRLPNETRIIDTPGIREFGLWKLSREELSGYFEEFEALSPRCRFNDCSHSHEPQCAVREAAASGTLDTSRYETYLRILASLSAER